MRWYAYENLHNFYFNTPKILAIESQLKKILTILFTMQYLSSTMDKYFDSCFEVKLSQLLF